MTCGRADHRQCFWNEMDRRHRCLVCSVFSINHYITMDYLFHSPDVFMQESDVFHSALPCVHLGSRNGGNIWQPPSKRSIRSWRASPDPAGRNSVGQSGPPYLRHTAASQAVMSGEGLTLVGRLLGHNRHRTTAGYAHLVEAAEKVGAIIAAAMAGQRPRPITHRQ